MKRRFFIIFIPMAALMVGSFIIMIKSFDTDESWRIGLSTIGFAGFFIMTSLFSKSMIKRINVENEQKNGCAL